jgi:hypothetical protein
MWSFKKEEPEIEKPDRKEKLVEELKQFRAKGEKFKYLGVEMIVTGHKELFIAPYCCTYFPCIKASYVNKQGDIKNVQFDYDELEVLKKENL